MQLLDFTLIEPASNLALDEALLEQAEAADWSGSEGQDLLRLWEPRQPLVVLGRSSPIDQEVNRDYCRHAAIPVHRRCSGGATIITGPGCLMYAVRLSYDRYPEIRMLDRAHQFVMRQMQAAVQRLGIAAEIAGISDLAWQQKKFSGNSLRCRRAGLLYHGTMICRDFDVGLVSRCLGEPVRQPNYRHGRSHEDFLTQLPCSTESLKQAIAEQWSARELIEPDSGTLPLQLCQKLVDDKYHRY